MVNIVIIKTVACFSIYNTLECRYTSAHKDYTRGTHYYEPISTRCFALYQRFCKSCLAAFVSSHSYSMRHLLLVGTTKPAIASFCRVIIYGDSVWGKHSLYKCFSLIKSCFVSYFEFNHNMTLII